MTTTYIVTKTVTSKIKIDGHSPGDALYKADDYENEYRWSDEVVSYRVDEA